ncbi:MAG: WD40 repeat domain-containing protein [Deltaproteobacteria bacterium]|nr:WD40 repeat domain-containing protein [Deltaproteobacteria bacterium]
MTHGDEILGCWSGDSGFWAKAPFVHFWAGAFAVGFCLACAFPAQARTRRRHGRHHRRVIRPRGACRLDGPVKSFVLVAGKPVRSVAVSADGRRAAAVVDGSGVWVWNLPAGGLAARIVRPGKIGSVALSPDGMTLAVSWDQTGIGLWTLRNGVTSLGWWKETTGVLALAFSPDGRLLAYGGRRRSVTIRPVRGGSAPVVGMGHTSWVSALVFGRAGKTLYSGAWDDTVRAWRVLDGHALWRAPVHSFAVNAIALAGSSVISGSDDGRTKVDRTSDGAQIKTRRWGQVKGLAVLLGGRYLAAGTWGGRLLLVDAASMGVLQNRRGEAGPVESLAGGGRTVMVGGPKGSVKVYELTGCVASAK